MLWVQSQAPNKPGVAVPLCDHSNWEVEEGGSSSTQWIWGQLGLHESQNNHRAEKMAQQEKVPAVKPDILSLSSQNPLVEGVDKFLKVILWPGHECTWTKWNKQKYKNNSSSNNINKKTWPSGRLCLYSLLWMSNFLLWLYNLYCHLAFTDIETHRFTTKSLWSVYALYSQSYRELEDF